MPPRPRTPCHRARRTRQRRRPRTCDPLLVVGGAHRTSSERFEGTRMSSRINHVSVNACDLEASVDFYVDLLGAERIATPNFGLPVQWLGLGRTQLHLFEKDVQPTSQHHLGITVDDLEPV